MANVARFKIGTSGSGKHTEVVGDGSGMGGSASRQAEEGPRVGPGVLGRVDMEVGRACKGDGGRPKVRKMSTYDEE